MNATYHRPLCAFFALVFLVFSILPAAPANAAEGTSASTATLTAAQTAQMQQADEAVTALTDSEDYAAMTQAERQDAALEQLEQLADEGLVDADSIYVDEESAMVSFTYPCGVLGGILLVDLDEENDEAENEEFVTLPSLSVSANAASPVQRGSAVIYYAFDNTVNSSRYPYYSYMKTFWDSMGLDTRLDTSVTVSDLRRIGRYDLCILSAHGAYYTYMTGKLFTRFHTDPVILLTEKVSFYKDALYGLDLLTHRIIKINGLYAVTPSFFSDSYFITSVENTIVFSETCEFLGTDDSPDDSMAEAILECGASAVIGYRNNVYTVYSRSLLWATVNNLVLGESVAQSLTHAQEVYGENDVVWYRAQGGRRPHSSASYAVLYGDASAHLPVSIPSDLEQAA